MSEAAGRGDSVSGKRFLMFGLFSFSGISPHAVRAAGGGEGGTSRLPLSVLLNTEC